MPDVCDLQGGQGLMSNGTQVVVSAVNPADLATKLKDATQVVQVPPGALSSIDWAAKLKVSFPLLLNFERVFWEHVCAFEINC